MVAKNLASRSQKGQGSSRKRKTDRKENGRPQKKARKSLHPIKKTLTEWKEHHLPRDALQSDEADQAEVTTFEDDATLLALSENKVVVFFFGSFRTTLLISFLDEEDAR